MGYFGGGGSGGTPNPDSVGSAAVIDKSLLPADFHDGSSPGQLLVTGPANAWGYSPAPASAPAIPPTFMLAGDSTRPDAPVVITQLASGATGNLHEWRAVDGSILAHISASGALHGDGAGLTNVPVAVHVHDASAINAGVLGDARLAANVARLDVVQTFTAAQTFAGTVRHTSTLTVGPTALPANTQMAVYPAAAGVRGLFIQGFASQTANLIEVQNSASQVIARLDAGGKVQSARYILQVPSAGAPDLALIPVTGGQSVLAAWHGLQINALRLGSPDYTPANVGGADDYHVIIPLNQAAKVGVGIRAKAGQTGDLQQWQDGAGAVLARVSATGVLYGDGSGLTNVPVSAHVHDAGAISSGLLDGDRLPAMSASKRGAVPATGMPSGRFLRDDGTWQAVSGGGGYTLISEDVGTNTVTLAHGMQYSALRVGRIVLQGVYPCTIYAPANGQAEQYTWPAFQGTAGTLSAGDLVLTHSGGLMAWKTYLGM